MKNSLFWVWFEYDHFVDGEYEFHRGKRNEAVSHKFVRQVGHKCNKSVLCISRECENSSSNGSLTAF